MQQMLCSVCSDPVRMGLCAFTAQAFCLRRFFVSVRYWKSGANYDRNRRIDMNNWTIRAVCPEDADFLTTLMNTPGLMTRLHQTPTGKRDWEESIALWLADADEEGYIVSSQGQQVGWVAVNGLLSPQKLPYLKIAVLLPEFQNQGLGRQIIRQLMAELRKRGYPAIRLFVDQDNRKARRCYESCGFQSVGTVCQQWPDGTVCTQLEMEATIVL